jgi:Mn-dependent DtxR family transcriptional regulator
MNLSAKLPDERHLIAAHMLIQGRLSDAAIRFFTAVYDYLTTNEKATCSELARQYRCTPQAASKHLKVLVSNHYLTRPHYRAWTLNKSTIDLLKGDTQ